MSVIPVAYYISGHGYGHGARSCQVMLSMKKACPDLELHLRTTVPSWLFQDLPFPVSYERREVDVGVVQEDCLSLKLDETFWRCRDFHERLPDFVEEELAFIARQKIRLVVGDIPPVCFEVAWAAGLPSAGIANFSWDWIYRAYLSDFPSFLPLIEEMERFYRKATLALSLPFSCDLGVFPNRKPIPLIARVSALDKTEARKRWDLPATACIIFLSFGGLGLKRLPWERLFGSERFFFVTTGGPPRRGKNFLVLPEVVPHYEDLVRAADAVVSKPGYGMVADAIAHQVPLVYTARGDFPEYPFLVKTIEQWATSEFIPQEDLLAGNLDPSLDRLLAKERNWPAVPLNGAETSAAEMVSLLSDR